MPLKKRCSQYTVDRRVNKTNKTNIFVPPNKFPIEWKFMFVLFILSQPKPANFLIKITTINTLNTN